jgi:hypothetical protein
VADAAGPTQQQLTPVAYWADAEANSVAIQLLWPRVPAWHTSAHCEGPQEFRRVECQGEPEMATRQHQARAGEGLPFCADRRSKMGRANRTSAGPRRGHPARSRTCVSASMLPRALASVAAAWIWLAPALRVWPPGVPNVFWMNLFRLKAFTFFWRIAIFPAGNPETAARHFCC